MTEQKSAVSALTDGTGVSSLTVPKVAKDFIVDFVKAFAAVLIGSNIATVQQGIDNPHVVLIAAIGALLSTGYRFILSWGSA